MIDIAKFTDAEFAASVAKVFKTLTHGKAVRPRHPKPRAILLGGQSGAGKTTLHSIFRQKECGDIIVINGDEYRREHPRSTLLRLKYGDDWVKHTALWSGKMTEALIDKLSLLGYNLIIEGTLRTSEVPMKTARLLRERGYDVSLALMAVKPEISLISCQIRHEEMRIAGTTPRATDPAHHAKIVHDIVDNLSTLEESGLFSQVYLYTRSEECLYPAKGKSAAEVLRDRIFGEWNTEEQAHYERLQKRLEELKAR